MSNGKPQETGPVIARAAEVEKEIEKLRNLDTLKAEDLVRMARDLGKDLARYMNTSQIRRFLDEVNRIRSDSRLQKEGQSFRESCMLLKPKLAYAAGRQKGGGQRERQQGQAIKDLMQVLVPCIDKVHDEKDFYKFYRFVESIVAYHRYYGGE